MKDTSESITQVARALGHDFQNAELLREALTHSSYANERPKLAPEDNDRLEFMGDAVLQWAVSALLWEKFPKASAGELTRRRADLVCENGLARIARSVGIGEGLLLGKGEERSGGRNKSRLLASAFEACIAAVFLDAGTEVTLQVCRVLFDQYLDDQSPGASDYKTRVQEFLQRQGQQPPQYNVIASKGPDHDRSFKVIISTDEGLNAIGNGRSKLEAEQEAARALIEQFEEEDDDEKS